MALSDLQRASDMTFFEFAECLKRLMGVGYLTVIGQPGRETAQITNLGAEVADLARPRYGRFDVCSSTAGAAG